MIDYELMRSELEERRARARRAAETRRLVAGSARRPWRSAVGLGVARLGLRLAGPGAVAAPRVGQAR